MPDRSRTITLARLTRRPGQISLFEDDLGTDIRRSVSSALQVERYGRRWRFSRAVPLAPGSPGVARERVDQDSELLAGKLGFERLTATEAVRYDPDREDYVTELKPSEVANFCHFVIDLGEHYIAFEERPPDIQRRSFIGAFQALLQQAALGLSIDLVADSSSFTEWLQEVRLVRFSTRARRPNPTYRDDVQDIRAVIEGTGADEVVLDARVDEEVADAELTVTDSVIAEAVLHAEDGYGTFSAIGIQQGRRRTFTSIKNVPNVRIVETEADTSESIWGRVREALYGLLPERDRR